jgi:beta-lactam-binding protein with PASTA domain
MNDSLKMFLIALVTAVATQFLLGPYILRLQGALPADPALASSGKVDPGTTAPAPSTLTPETQLAAPNLDGMKVADARDRFRDKGIVIIEDGERDGSGAEPGTIIQQRPVPGATLSSKEIRVIVAKGAETFAVPDVLGKDLSEARGALVEAGFEVPEPTREASDKPKGTILRQVPNPGARVTAGSPVRLVVAEQAAVEIPKVTGMHLRRATEALEEAGLKLGRVRRAEHPELGENWVLRQSPAPGDQVPPGTEVELVVVAPN